MFSDLIGLVYLPMHFFRRNYKYTTYRMEINGL